MTLWNEHFSDVSMKPDESNDSFLARCDVVWSELLAKQVKLDQIQSYIILRGAWLSTDDKKRVIVESESSSSGVLNMEKVTNQFVCWVLRFSMK